MVKKIKLKKNDILIFVFPYKLHPEQFKCYMDNLPKPLKNKILCIDNSLKVIHVDNEVEEEE